MYSATLWVTGFALLNSVHSAALPLAGNAIQERAAVTKPVNTKILLPAIHWDHDRSDYDNLKPQSTGSLYYAEPAGVQSTYLV